jgi:glycosyltransferase involved in cell wall biosynthesis
LLVKTLLALTPAPVMAAATRFRVQQFAPALRSAGINLVLRPFLDDRGFEILYRRGQLAGKVVVGARALAGRLRDLATAVHADAVLVHREAALIGPPVLEWAIARVLGRPLIFDLDDPVWVPYVSPTYGALLSRLMKMPGKTNATLKAASHVIAGNPHVADYARRFSPRVELIPTVVDTTLFTPVDTGNPIPVIGWIGTHSAAPFLRQVLPALRRLAGEHAFVLRLIGGDADTRGIPTELRAWSLAREVADFQSIDIGLYPLTDDAWSRGKSGFKAVQYMACGKPIVASPVGVTRDMVRAGENGFLVDSDDGWYVALRALVLDASLRARLGATGRAQAEARWSLGVHAPRFVDVILRAMGAHGV